MNTTASPPAVAVRLSRVLLSAEDADRLLDALADEYPAQLTCLGERGAKRWYWWQLVRSVLPLRRSRRQMTRHLYLNAIVVEPEASYQMNLQHIMYDLKFAARSLAKRPSWTAVVVGTLGVGIGATLATFAVFYALLMAPLPFHDAERLVRVYNRNVVNGIDRLHFSAPGAAELRDRVRSFASVGVIDGAAPGSANLIGVNGPDRIRVIRVNAEYFVALGVQVLAGRAFDRADETPNARVAVVSQAVFERELKGSVAALGNSIRIDDQVVSVVGVIRGVPIDPIAGRIDVWLPAPLAGAEQASWANNRLSAFARLANGVSIEQARAELAHVATGHAVFGRYAMEKAFTVIPARDDLVGDVRPLLTAVMAAVLMVLLLTCSNVASLMLARVAAREQEFATRTALGSSRSRLARLLVFDAALVGAAGALLGVLVGAFSLRALLSIAPAGLPLRETVGFGPGPLVAAGTLGAIIGLALGIATTLPVLFRRGSSPISLGARSGMGRHGALRFRSVLVVADVSLAVMLLVGAGILIRTVSALQNRDLGVEVANASAFRVDLPSSRYGEPAARIAFQRDLSERLAAIPAVEAVGAVSHLPVTGSHNTWGSRAVSGTREGTDADNTQAEQRVVHGKYFDAVGIPLISGRLFDASDIPGGVRAVLVNQSAVTTFFGTDQPLGRELLVGQFRATVIGVVADVAQTARSGPAPTIYHNYDQFGAMMGWPMHQVLRIKGQMPAPWPSVRSSLAAIDPRLVLHDVQRLPDVVGAGMAEARFASVLLRFFAGLATVVAALGLFALLTHSVTTRRHDIGIRLAVGANATEVRAMIVRQGLSLAIAGTVIGVGLAMGLAGVLDFLVYGIDARDPLTFALVPVVVLAVSLLASWGPAQVATRIDPRALLNGD